MTQGTEDDMSRVVQEGKLTAQDFQTLSAPISALKLSKKFSSEIFFFAGIVCFM